MAVIKVRDLAYGRLRSPDLDAQEAFLTAFGMVRTERTPTALYMRGTDPVHHIHVTEKGDPGFIGFAVGRSSFLDAIVNLHHQKITREAAVAEIAGKFEEWIRVFEAAKK